MKKSTLIPSILLILTLTACASPGTTRTVPASGDQNNPAAPQLPAATQLILGTFNLENTDQSVTAEQAAELLPLWQTIKVLAESDTAAQQETEALVTQVQETMTSEQMQAIADMNLTRADMLRLMQEQGLAVSGSPAGRPDTNSQGSNSNSGRGFPGGFPGGDGPGGPGDGPGAGGGGQGTGLSRQQIATAQASRQQRGGDVVPPMLLDALINYLQEKAGS